MRMIVCKYSISRTGLLAALLLLISFNSKAQEEFVPPIAKLITRFPFIQLTGGIILIRAALDEKKDSLTFVLDTGSGGISLDSATVEELNIVSAKSDKTIRGIAGMREVSFAYNHSLRLPNLRVDSLNFHINDYDLLTSVYGIKIDGIIGYSLLKRYIIKINYDLQEIEVYSQGLFKYPRGGYLLKPRFSPLPTEQLILKDERAVNSRFILDTGAGLCLLLSEDFVDDSLFISKKRKRYPTQAEGLGGKKLMNLTVVKQVHLGPYKFKNVPAYIFDDAFNVTSYPLLSGVIGNDLLRRFNVILNYADRSIYIKPNKHFLDYYDYGYSGLSIYEINKAVTVADIMPNSPGEKAGFKPGDIILGVDNVLFKNIQAVKVALQNAGASVHLVIVRNGELMDIKMKIKSILSRK